MDAKENLVTVVASKLPTSLNEQWAKELLDAIVSAGWRIVYAPNGLGTGPTVKGYDEWQLS